MARCSRPFQKPARSYPGTPITLVNFNGTDGASPDGALIADAAGDLFGIAQGGGGTVFEVVKTGGGYANTPTVLVNWNNPEVSEYLEPGLVMDAAGDLFGAT